MPRARSADCAVIGMRNNRPTSCGAMSMPTPVIARPHPSRSIVFSAWEVDCDPGMALEVGLSLNELDEDIFGNLSVW